MRKTIRATKAQRDALDQIRRQLKEGGYMLLGVAEEYRRNPRDMIAFPTHGGTIFFYVRPERKGAISFQPFAGAVHYTQLRTQLKKWRKDLRPVRLRWRSRELVFRHHNRNQWFNVISKPGKKELHESRIAYPFER